MAKYQDIQITDITLRNQFIDYWMNGQYDQAFAIITNNPQLDTKAFTSTCFTLIAQAITVLENYFFNGVTDYLTAQLTNYNAAISQFRNKSTYVAATAYVVGNFVVYNNDVYLCIQDSTGNLPTNTTYWVYLGLQGAQGGAGIDVNLRYNWSPAVNYITNDVVLYGNILYVATQPSTGQIPSTTSSYWNEFLEMPKSKIIVSATEPTSDMLYDGLIWWQIIN